MAYRQGAFDWFDTVFCSGPHHVNEIRCIEEKYNLPQKKYLNMDIQETQFTKKIATTLLVFYMLKIYYLI
jgi:hypothetical protein